MFKDDSVFLTVLPSWDGFFKSVEKGAKEGGQRAATAFADTMEKKLATAEKAVDRVGRAFERAEIRHANAADATRVAEAKLLEVMNDSAASASKIADATAKFNKARRDEESAAKAARRAQLDLKSAEDEAAKAAKNLENAQKGAAGAVDDLGDKAAGAARSTSHLADTVEDAGGRFRGLGIGAVAGVFASVTQSVLGSMGDLAAGAFAASDATDKFRSTLGFAGLDTSAIDAATKSAQAYADRTVYNLSDIQSMTAQLAANGVADYTGLAEAAGNLNAVAGGNAETFKSVGMVMSQTAGAGKLTTENWNQLADAIPGASGKLQEALLQAGAYTGNFRDQLAKGEITAEEFNAAVMKLGNEPVAVEAAQSTATFEGMIGNLQATLEGGLANAFTQLKPHIETFINGITDLAETWIPRLTGFLGTMIDNVTALSGWMRENSGLITTIGVGIGAMAAGMQAYSIWQSIVTAGGLTAWLKQAAGSMALFNGAMWASPVTWIVAGITAVVAGLVLFFTKTETGRAMWEKFTTSIAGFWENTLKPAFVDFANIAKTVFAVAFVAAVTPAMVAWNVLSTGIQWAWANLIKPTWDAIVAVAGWMWNTILAPIFGAIKAGFDGVAFGIQWAWDNIIRPAWDALGNGIKRVWDAVISPVFESMKIGVNLVKDAFGIAADGIARLWDGVRGAAARPIKFVIDSVFNNGIVAAWNKVAGWVGLDPIEKYEPEWLQGYARGGILPGFSRMRDGDDQLVPMRRGEGVLVSEGLQDQKSRRLFLAANEAAKGGRSFAEFVGGYAGGGIIDSITALVREKFPMMTITSTYRPGDPGHHGSGRAVDFSNGTDTTPEMQSAAGWFAANYGSELLELIHSPFDGNIKNGQSVGDGFGFYGAGTMNAHRNHVHIAAANALAGGKGGPGGLLGLAARGMSAVSGLVKSAWDGIMGAIQVPEFPGLIGKLPGAALTKLRDTVWDFVKSKVPASSAAGAYAGPVGAGVEQWRGLVESILKAKGHPVELTDTVLRRMNQESGGNPAAINDWDINAVNGTPSKGLMQVIDPTFASYKDPGYDDIWDPESNIRASMNYAMARYGSLPAAYNRAGGYALGGIVDFAGLYDSGGWIKPGRTLVENRSGKPEPVFTGNQWSELSDGFSAIHALAAAVRGGNAGRMMADEAEWAGIAWKEILAAWRGDDFGLAAVARYLGGEKNGRAFLDAVEALGANIGEFNDTAESWGKTQAETALDWIGLGSLVPAADAIAGWTDWGALERELRYGPAPVETPVSAPAAVSPSSDVSAVAATVGAVSTATTGGGTSDTTGGGGVETLQITAESSSDFVKMGDLERLDGRVVKIETVIGRPAAAVTRGGVA